MSSKLNENMNVICSQTLDGKESKVEQQSRRVWAQNFAFISASAAVAWACGSSGGSNKAVAATYSAADMTSDANTMNIALGLELEAIALYTAASTLPIWDMTASALAPTFLEVAKVFLGHHTSHKNALITQINAIKSTTGVSPVSAKSDTEYFKPYPTLTAQTGAAGLLLVLQVAAEREMNAANAYHGVIKSFKNVDLMQTLGGLSADEAGHYGVLNAASFVHAVNIGKSAETMLDQTTLISSSLPPFTYPRTVRAAV